MVYRAPVSEFRFILDEVVDFAAVTACPRFEDAGTEAMDAILGGAARLAEQVMAPLNRTSDLQGARLVNGQVRTSPGFPEAYAEISLGGWVALSAGQEHGGMGLPLALTSCVNDMMGSACLALQLNALMTQGAVEAIAHHAPDAIKAIYLPKLIAGEWCGTMNLTEPQAGSDVGALRTRAEDNGDGSWSIRGQKIFISWADNDFAANICHLVLARRPGAPEGSRGISLFLVPKFIPDADGTPGPANSLSVVSLESKLGMHGSPTAVMQYEGARGWLLGEPDRGLAAMFTMMNNARLGVGLQGISAAEGAYQHALSWAMQRVQGRPVAGVEGTIIDHPDVRRMLMEMSARIFAARSIALANAVALDMAAATGEAHWAGRGALLTPITKAFGTETGIEVSQGCIQVHGGMGCIEEAGASQFLRDVRVTAIYEGTNGIQAADLVGRKMADGGDAARALLIEVLTHAEGAELPDLAMPVAEAARAMLAAIDDLLAMDQVDRLAGSVAFLQAFALVLGGHFHLRAALAERRATPELIRRQALARVFIRRLMPGHVAHLAALRDGAAPLYALSSEELSR